MDKRLRKIFKRAAKEGLIGNRRVHWVHSSIEQRAGYRRILDTCVEDGKIGYVRSGMDCDCTQYRREDVRPAPAGAFVFQREEDEHQSWLDGPESTYWLRPSETEKSYRSADRALEAYEDGHPSVVYWGDL